MGEDNADPDGQQRLLREKAFVVQLATMADPGSGFLVGRVVHIDSGHATAFESAGELFRFFAEMQG